MYVTGFQCPEIDMSAYGPTSAKPSHYSAITGAGRNGELWTPTATLNCGAYNTDGVMYPESATTFHMICDGASNTLLIGERLIDPWDWISGAAKEGAPINDVCSGSAKNVRYSINAPPGPAGLSLNDLPFGSEHARGAHFGYADGSVHFLSETLDFTIFQDLATRDGAETGDDVL
jgi:prepilin-type processing-associated H-X9-DG protein